jgi:putative ABC transport system substrate-binding protein
MHRRNFIGFICAGIAAQSVAARAQQRRPMIVGLLSSSSELEMRPLRAALVRKLNSLGWREGETFELDVQLYPGNAAALSEAAQSLTRRVPDVIVAQGSPALAAIKKSSESIPTVFLLVADPVGQGLIKTLSHPGGTSTGLTNFEFSFGGKWVELLKRLNPDISRILLIANPENATSAPFSEQISLAGRSLNTEVKTTYVRNTDEIEAAIRTLGEAPNGALITLPDFLPLVNRDLIVKRMTELRLPSIHPFRAFPLSGAVMSYGLDFPELYQQAAVYVDKILRGIKPMDLPVQAPNKFELVINLKTAKTLNIEVAPELLASADEVIE